MRRLLFLLVLGAASVSAQPTSLTLFVKDAETAAPLPALLDVEGVRGAADQLGRAELVGMEEGPLRVVASLSGYVPIDTTLAVAAGVANVALLALRPDHQVLGHVVVEAEKVNDAVLRRRGFFERRENRTGVFLTRAELDQRGAMLFSDVFRSVPGVRVQREAGVASLVSTRRLGCPMAIYLDGTESVYLARSIDAVPYDDIAAVEIYRGPSEVPIEYGRTKGIETCGAVLVWTRIAAGD